MRYSIVFALALFALGCRTDDGSGIQRVGSMTLEETDSARVRAPMMVPDPHGGYLMIDRDAAQVRRYDDDGDLLWAQGRAGGAAGEYERLSGVARLENGNILVLETDGSATVLDSAGTGPVQVWDTGLRNVERAVVVDDSLVLTSGSLFAEANGPRLHLLHTGRQRTVVAFFAPYDALEAKLLASNLFYVPIARSDDELAAVFPATDTVYFFSLDGIQRDKVPFPTERFRRAEASTPEVMSNRSLRAAYLQSIHLVSNLEWLPNGTIVVSYWSLPAPRGASTQPPPEWVHGLAMSRDGTRITEDSVAGRLLTRTLAGDTLLFADAEGAGAAGIAKMIVR